METETDGVLNTLDVVVVGTHVMMADHRFYTPSTAELSTATELTGSRLTFDKYKF